MPGIAAQVDAPGLHWADAVGYTDRTRTRTLTAGHSFRLASVTKTFTAAAVLALADGRRVSVDAPITRYLPAPYPQLLRQGGYRPEAITVRHLLHHTSGLYDYGTDNDYVEAVLTDPRHRWTAAEQVTWAMQHGQPYGPPGHAYRYSDTGYVLLARIVEAVTRLPQAAAYRELLRYRHLGLTSTWFETLERTPGGAGNRAHQYFVAPEIGLDVDLYDADPSYDLYGGGGLVSTVADLNQFYRALLDGRVLTRASLRLMLTTLPSEYGPAGMGIFATTVAGTLCWWHAGFIGTAALYCPGSRLAVSVTVNAFTQGTDDPHALDDAVELATTVIRTGHSGPTTQ